MKKPAYVILLLILLLAQDSYETFGGKGDEKSRKKRTLGQVSVPVGRTWGETHVEPHSYPFIAVIEQWIETDWVPVSHATIYNPHTVMLSAQTLDTILPLIETRELRIMAGMHQYPAFENTRQYRQPCAADKLPTHAGEVDSFAVLHLADYFVFNKYVHGIQLPADDVPVPEDCIVTGYGKEDKDTHFEELPFPTSVSFQSPADCTPAHPSIICHLNQPGLAKLDAGTPLFCTHRNRLFAYGIGVNRVKEDDSESSSNYFMMQSLDLAWFNDTLLNAIETCRAKYQTLP